MKDAFKTGNSNIDEDKIKDLVGIPKFVYINNIISGIIEKDIEKSIDAMNDVLNEGKDLENFVWEMIKYTKDILIYKVTKKLEIYSEEEENEIKKISEKVSKQELINIIYSLSELENKMKISSQKTIIFETEIIKLCAYESYNESKSAISSKTKKEDEKTRVEVKQKETPKVTMEAEQNKTIDNLSVESSTESNTKTQETKQETEQTKPKILAKGENLSDWPKAINNLKKQGKVMLYANLINTDAIMINDMTVSIRFNSGLNAFRKELLQKPENLNVLNKEVAMICGKPMQIKFEDASQSNTNTVKNTYIKQETKPNVQQETNIGTVTKQQEDLEEQDDLSDLDIPINFVEEE